MNVAANRRAKRARDSRARDTDGSSVASTSTIDDSQHRLQQTAETSNTIKHIKYDAGAYEGFEERENDQLGTELTANGTDFTAVQVPVGAPTDLVCEECERRDAIGCCESCGEVLCASCLAIMHIPRTGGQAHAHLAQDSIRTLRVGDGSSVVRADEDFIPPHEIDEEEMATRRDLSVPSSLDAPSIDLVSRTARRNAAAALHTKGQLVVFKAASADCLPNHLAYDWENEEGHHNDTSSLRQDRGRPQELYGEVMSVPMTRHGEWGHARRRGQGHRLHVRVRILGRASLGYSEPFVEEWLQRKHRREGPREPVVITGGDGPDPLAQEVSAAKVKDMERDGVQKTLVPPQKELPVTAVPGRLPEELRSSITLHRAGGGGGGSRALLKSGRDGIINDNHEQATVVVLVPEDELFAVEVKREELKRRRCAIVETCSEGVERRQRACRVGVAFKRWYGTTVNIRNAHREEACQVVQRWVRATLARMRRAGELEAEEKALWEAGRRLHKHFRYLDTQELRQKAGGGVTTDGRVFVQTKAELNRLEALRRVMAERSFRMLCKGVFQAKTRAFKHWRNHTEWERRENQPYVFSVAKDASLAGDTVEEAGPCKTGWRHPSHGIAIPALPRVHSGRVSASADGRNGAKQPDSVAAARVARKIAGPAPFCSWLVPGLVLMASYIDSESKARPLDFKQPLYQDAASQIMLAGVGTLVGLSPEEAVRKYEMEHNMPKFEQAFGVSHKMILASIKLSMGEAKHDMIMLRQEEKNIELLRSVEGYDQQERRKALADNVGRMRIARSAYTVAKRQADLFPQELRVTWEPLTEDEAPSVDAVVETAVRLEDRLRAGEKLCLWSPRGHGRIGLVGAVLLGRLYGCTAENALLRVQVCHDARENLKGQPQISCPQTIAQVCKSVRGEGQPSLRQSERVPDDTQADRWNREKEHRRQIDTIQDDQQPYLMQRQLLPLAVATNASTSSTLSSPPDAERRTPLPIGADPVLGHLAGSPFGGKADASGSRGSGVRGGSGIPFPRKLGTVGSYARTLVDDRVDRESLPSAQFGKDTFRHQPPTQQRTRAVGAVPQPTLRSLRKA